MHLRTRDAKDSPREGVSEISDWQHPFAHQCPFTSYSRQVSATKSPTAACPHPCSLTHLSLPAHPWLPPKVCSLTTWAHHPLTSVPAKTSTHWYTHQLFTIIPSPTSCQVYPLQYARTSPQVYPLTDMHTLTSYRCFLKNVPFPEH